MNEDKSFPAEIFVAVEESDEETWLVVADTPEGHAVDEDSRPVAKYVLQEIGDVRQHTETEYVPRKAPKHE